MGKIWTAGPSYQGTDRLDISVATKSHFGLAFAPNPDMERLPRDNDKAWGEYQTEYHARMRRVWARNQLTFHKLLEKAEVTLVCSCADPERCHRSLLAEYLGRADPERTHLCGERDQLPLAKAAPPALLRPQLMRCFAEGCGMSVGRDKLMCKQDWDLIPKPVQDTLRATFRKGQVLDPAVMSEAYVNAAREARTEVAAAHLRRQRGAKVGAAQ